MASQILAASLSNAFKLLLIISYLISSYSQWEHLVDASYSLTVGRRNLHFSELPTFLLHLFSQSYLLLFLATSGISKNYKIHNHTILRLKEKYMTQVFHFPDEESEAPKD